VCVAVCVAVYVAVCEIQDLDVPVVQSVTVCVLQCLCCSVCAVSEIQYLDIPVVQIRDVCVAVFVLQCVLQCMLQCARSKILTYL